MYPLLGSEQGALPFGAGPLAVRSRALWSWRACDGGDEPLTGQPVVLRKRTATATVLASDGTSGSVAVLAPAWTAVDWDGDTVREELHRLLGTDEAIRGTDVGGGGLFWPVRDLSGLHEWVHSSSSAANHTLWSFTNDAASGAYLALRYTSASALAMQHHNGTTLASSPLTGLVDGDRCSLRWQFTAADGRVRAWLVRNAGAESDGGLSGAATPAASWGGGSGVLCRLNEFGTGSRGIQRLRASLVAPGLLSRTALEQLL